MKNSLLCTLVLMVAVATVHAKPSNARHTSSAEEVKLGAKLKLHSAVLTAEKEEAAIKDRLVFRPAFDLFGEWGFSDMWGVQASLGYSGQGERTQMPKNNNQKYEVDSSLNYIMLSVIPRFYPGNDRQFCLFIGPRVSWLASAKTQEYLDGKEKGDAKDLLSEKIPEEFQPKRINWGILFGLDYEFDMGILLGLDYNVGVTNINKGSPDSKTLSGGLTLGYNFAKLIN